MRQRGGLYLRYPNLLLFIAKYYIWDNKNFIRDLSIFIIFRARCMSGIWIVWVISHQVVTVQENVSTELQIKTKLFNAFQLMLVSYVETWHKHYRKKVKRLKSEDPVHPSEQCKCSAKKKLWDSNIRVHSRHNWFTWMG